MKKRVGRFLILWLLLGVAYSQLELFFRGFTYVQMTFIGGLCGALIGLLDAHPAYYNRTMFQQCVLGTLIVLLIEYISGYLFNIKLGMDIWDYTCLPCNLRGQICLPTAVIWFFICPLAVWLDDYLRFRLFAERKPESPLRHYIRLFTFR